MLKTCEVGWWWVAYKILLSAPGPFGFNWDLVGVGPRGFGTKGLTIYSILIQGLSAHGIVH